MRRDVPGCGNIGLCLIGYPVIRRIELFVHFVSRLKKRGYHGK